MRWRRTPGGLVFLSVCVVGLCGVALVARERRAAAQRLAAEQLTAVAKALAAEAKPFFAGPPEARQAVDAAVRGWARVCSFRVMALDGQGRVVADSATAPALLDRLPGEGTAEEVAAARLAGVGTARRRAPGGAGYVLFAAAAVGGLGDRALGFVRVAAAAPRSRFPWLVTLVVALCASVAAGVAQAWEGALYRRVARHLAMWSDLPAGVDLESLAEDADRHFRAQREEAERAQQAMQAALAEVGEGVVLVDGQARLRFANRAAERLLGTSLPPGRPLVEAVRAPELVGAVHSTLQQRSANFTSCGGAEGAELAVRVCPLAHPVLVAAVVLRDVRGERQLERARRALVADLAHELRTPLTVLAGLAEEVSEQAALADLAGALARQVRRLTTFAEDLEALAAIESGQVKLHPERVELLAVARQVLGDLESLAGTHQVALAAEGGEVWVETDPVRLAQVLTNLVSNGIRFNRPGGRVTVTVAPEDGGAALVVADTGVGIPPQEIPFVFQRFYRVRRDAQVSGSGLGLAIVKHLVKALGGTVHLTSQEGVGTTVTVHLPPALPPTAS